MKRRLAAAPIILALTLVGCSGTPKGGAPANLTFSTPQSTDVCSIAWWPGGTEAFALSRKVEKWNTVTRTAYQVDIPSGELRTGQDLGTYGQDPRSADFTDPPFAALVTESRLLLLDQLPGILDRKTDELAVTSSSAPGQPWNTDVQGQVLSSGAWAYSTLVHASAAGKRVALVGPGWSQPTRNGLEGALSDDEGQTWKDVFLELPTTVDDKSAEKIKIQGLAVDSDAHCHVIAAAEVAQQKGILYLRTTDGSSWDQVAFFPGLEKSAIASNKAEKNTLYIVSLAEAPEQKRVLQMSLSKDAGKTWSAPATVVEGSGLDRQTDHLRLDASGRLVVAGWFREGQFHLSSSTDGGKTWSVPETAIPCNTNIKPQLSVGKDAVLVLTQDPESTGYQTLVTTGRVQP